MRYVITVNQPQLAAVLSSMKQLGITPVSQSFNFIITPDIPDTVMAKIKALPGVTNVSPERTSKIQVVGVESKLTHWMDLAKMPFGIFQANAWAKAQDAGMTKIPTGDSRKMVEADIAEDMGITGKGIKVAVIDTGIAPNPQGFYLPNNVYQKSEMPVQFLPGDEVGHGTWCVTCIQGAEKTLQSKAILKGVAPGVTIGIFKCLGYGVGTGFDSTVLAAMEDAQKWGADILSASLGSSYETDDPSTIPQCLAAEQLINAGMIVCFANGNDGPGANTVNVPANDPEIISVGAVDPVTGTVADFSSRGPTAQGVIKPDLVAPGVTITSSSTGWIAAMQSASQDLPGTASISGTSMATPHAVGTIALALQYARARGKKLTNKDIISAMSLYGDYPGTLKNNTHGYGLITFSRLRFYIDNYLT